jgi:hypothetical protein
MARKPQLSEQHLDTLLRWTLSHIEINREQRSKHYKNTDVNREIVAKLDIKAAHYGEILDVLRVQRFGK